jgi:hypothetical protein
MYNVDYNFGDYLYMTVHYMVYSALPVRGSCTYGKALNGTGSSWAAAVALTLIRVAGDIDDSQNFEQV